MSDDTAGAEGAEEGAVVAPSFAEGIPNDCPPAQAEAAEGQVYRVVSGHPLTGDDFQTWVELERIDPDRVCDCFGLSVFRDLEDAELYAEKYPHLGQFVAQATLSPDHGKTLPTPRRGNSHVTWWPFTNVARHTLFSVVSEAGVDDVAG